jgi:hypothetical protein
MKYTSWIITLDTFSERQETIIHHIKPKDVAYSKLFGVRANDNPSWYKEENASLLAEYEQELAQFLWQYPWSDLITNYYFAILPQTRELIQKHRKDLGKILLLTCEEDFYEKYAQKYNYPIKPRDIIKYSDDHRRWEDDLRDALRRNY